MITRNNERFYYSNLFVEQFENVCYVAMLVSKCFVYTSDILCNDCPIYNNCKMLDNYDDSLAYYIKVKGRLRVL